MKNLLFKLFNWIKDNFASFFYKDNNDSSANNIKISQRAEGHGSIQIGIQNNYSGKKNGQ